MAGSKGIKRSASRIDKSSEDEGAPLHKSVKKSKTSSGSGKDKDKDGNPYWELSNKRRVGISKFRDMTMINIREFYEKDGEMLPGKKQYETFIKAIPEINTQLHKMGHDVEDSEDAGGVSTSGGAIPKPVKKSKSEARAKKANIEATSDEEEDDDDD